MSFWIPQSFPASIAFHIMSRGYFGGPQYLKAASFLGVRPRYYIIAIAIALIISISLLLRQHKELLPVKLLSIYPISPAKASSQPKPYIQTAQQDKPPSPLNAQTWTKPEGLKIIALIFYGRPETVSILDCYLKQNLVSNGGFLDEVHWAVNTDNRDSLNYLDRLVKTSHDYKKIVLPGLGFDSVWKHAVQRGNLYIKMDDDIVGSFLTFSCSGCSYAQVYVHKDAIPNLIYTKLRHPDAFDVSANIVNSPSLSWLHSHLGAIHPYLPELKDPDAAAERQSTETEVWRASSLPEWKGDNTTFPLGKGTNDNGVVEPDDPGAPPFPGHRWLPLRDNKNSLMRTPISETEFDAYGNGWKSWAIAAQQHYSLLQNIEADEMNRYHFGRSTDEHESIYTMGDSRMNINFLCIGGDDVVDNFPFPDVDEPALSWVLPQRLQRRKLLKHIFIFCNNQYGADIPIKHVIY